jgi:hypothetical protein
MLGLIGAAVAVATMHAAHHEHHHQRTDEHDSQERQSRERHTEGYQAHDEDCCCDRVEGQMLSSHHGPFLD